MGQAISAIGTKLYHSTNGTSYTQLARIKDYPDLFGDPNLVDTTDLEDTQQTNIPGTATSDTLTFTCNYTKDSFESVNELAGDAGYYALQFSDGSAFKWQGAHTMGIPGHGVDEAPEFTINVVASTDRDFVSEFTPAGA